MPNRSSKAILHGYELFVEEAPTKGAMTGESWRGRVLAPDGQPVLALDLEGPRSQDSAQQRAEEVARAHGRATGNIIPDGVRPEWIEE